MLQYICERIGAILDVTLFLILTSAFVSVIIVIIFIILMVKHHKKVKTIKERQEKELEKFRKHSEDIKSKIQENNKHFPN